MKKIILWLVLLAVAMQVVSAEVVVNEIMYNPAEGPDTEAEWLELYNDGPSAVNLSSWKIDGKAFEPAVIGPYGYLVVARELLNGADTDIYCFESIWGNGDGVWDIATDGFAAVDGTMSLTTDHTINLTNGAYTQLVHYSTAMGADGNNRTLERINATDFAESKALHGTPGKRNSVAQAEDGSSIGISFSIQAELPKVQGIAVIQDDLAAPGTQIMPMPGEERQIEARAVVLDQAGISRIQEVSLSIISNSSSRVFVMQKKSSLNSTAAEFAANFSMPYYLAPGQYQAAVSALDNDGGTGTAQSSFTYLESISFGIDSEELSLGQLSSGGIAVAAGDINFSTAGSPTIKNSGNVNLVFEAAGTPYVSSGSSIPAGSMEIKFGAMDFVALSEEPVGDGVYLNAGSNALQSLGFRLTVPQNAGSGSYAGRVTLTGQKR